MLRLGLTEKMLQTTGLACTIVQATAVHPAACLSRRTALCSPLISLEYFGSDADWAFVDWSA